jgi:hypothetical protein
LSYQGKFGAEDDKEDASGSGAVAAVDPTKTERFYKSVKVMERLVNQNAEDITFWKYKYADDKNEWTRPGIHIILFILYYFTG